MIEEKKETTTPTDAPKRGTFMRLAERAARRLLYNSDYDAPFAVNKGQPRGKAEIELAERAQLRAAAQAADRADGQRTMAAGRASLRSARQIAHERKVPPALQSLVDADGDAAATWRTANERLAAKRAAVDETEKALRRAEAAANKERSKLLSLTEESERATKTFNDAPTEGKQRTRMEAATAEAVAQATVNRLDAIVGEIRTGLAEAVAAVAEWERLEAIARVASTRCAAAVVGAKLIERLRDEEWFNATAAYDIAVADVTRLCGGYHTSVGGRDPGRLDPVSIVIAATGSALVRS